MQVPLRSEHETLSHEVFNALMWALSYPGEKQATQHANLEAIGQTLLDLETSFYTADESLKKDLQLTTAKFKVPEQADYLFFSKFEDSEIKALRSAKHGDLLYPDRSATIILNCKFDEGVRLKLTGPGIETQNTITISAIPEGFWQLHNETRNYPLGWDIFLCDGEGIVGIPRSVEVKF